MSIPVVKVKGSFYDMGLAQGKAVKQKVHELAAERLKLSLLEMEINGLEPEQSVCLAHAQRMLDAQKKWSPSVHEEFMGIADGADIDPARLLIANGYTDFRDVVVRQSSNDVTECTSLFVLPEATTTLRPYAAQTWDMHASAEPFIMIVYREPDEGPRTLSLTTAGCLSLIGVNEWGLSIGTNNVTPDDARPGVHYLALIHAALHERTLEKAVSVITGAPRASGHHYYIVHADGRAVGVETTATDYEVIDAVDGLYGYANHYRSARLAPKSDPLANSLGRHETVTRLLKENKAMLNDDGIKRILQDRSSLPDCICRYGDEPVKEQDDRSLILARTCAATVIDPIARGMWTVWGPPDSGRWEWHELEAKE